MATNKNTTTKLNGQSTFKDIAKVCNELSANMELQYTALDNKISEKLGKSDDATNALMLGGSKKEDFLMKAELNHLSTEFLDVDQSTLKLSYSYYDPINKSVTINKDMEISFDSTDENLAIPLSIIYIKASNSAKITFKNAKLLRNMPQLDDEMYSVVIHVSKIGDRWLVNEIIPVLEDEEIPPLAEK